MLSEHRFRRKPFLVGSRTCYPRARQHEQRESKVYDRSLLIVPPSVSAGRYSRGTAEDISAESKSPVEVPIDLTPIKTEHSKSSYRIFTSMRTDRRGELNGLIVVTKLSPYESNPDRARSVSLRPRGWSLQRGLRNTRHQYDMPRATCAFVALLSYGL